MGLNSGVAYAGEGDVPAANTLFTQIPGVIAQAPAGNPPSTDTAQQTGRSGNRPSRNPWLSPPIFTMPGRLGVDAGLQAPDRREGPVVMVATLADLTTKLAAWAAGKPTIKALYVLGSYTRSEQTRTSDLDLAFEFMNVHVPFVELITNAQAWKAEVSRLTGLVVKDVYLSTSPVAQRDRVLVFSRQ
jgi:predicted nucleotidyltransferase